MEERNHQVIKYIFLFEGLNSVKDTRDLLLSKIELTDLMDFKTPQAWNLTVVDKRSNPNSVAYDLRLVDANEEGNRSEYKYTYFIYFNQNLEIQTEIKKFLKFKFGDEYKFYRY